MTTETTSGTVTVPQIRIYGAGDLNRLPGNMFEYQGEVGREIVDFDTRYADLQDTITLRDQATLFQAYLLSELGQFHLDDDVRGVLDCLFKETGRGNVTKDACDYDNGDKGIKKSRKTDRRVLWKVGPERFEEVAGKWKAIGGEEYTILVPEEGFVIWTNDGGYRPDTGTPFETGSEEQAIKSMVDHGIPEEVARRTRSYFLSRGEDQGTAAVICCSGKRYGPFFVLTDWAPSGRYPIIGRIPASRSPRKHLKRKRKQTSS